jgi:L-asparaginase II
LTDAYQELLEITRGRIVESVHYGAAAVVDSSGRLLAWLGDPKLMTYLRSSAKPFQALPLIERGGDQTFHLTSKEVAIICGSHGGTDEHVEVIKGLQTKVGVQETDLLCGVQPPLSPSTQEAMRERGEVPTPNRHNCSGKHAGMLAHARLRGLPISDYVNPEHPVQQTILETMAEMCSLPVDQVEVGIDGCSAPNFAVPLYNAALGFARLCDPRGLSVERTSACRRITAAMMGNPQMVAGEERFDTRLMEICSGRLIAKGGAEGYMAMGVLAGVLGADSPGVGIVLKVSDGDVASHSGSDPNLRARSMAALEILRQMGYISDKELEQLAEFGPVKPVLNWRKLVVGEARPAFVLQRGETAA